MRLHGRTKEGEAYQRFYGSYLTKDGDAKEHDGDVCVKCESELPDAAPYEHPMTRKES